MHLRRLNILSWLLASGFWLLTSLSYSQTVFSSEADLKKEANRLFEEEEFAKAYPLFSQLLSLYPKDPQYNFRFGTCLMFSSNDKEKAIPYIEYGAKRQKQDVDKEVFFYLGKAYHLNYRFSEAIKYYNLYKGIASAKLVSKYDVDRQIEMCESGKQLLKNVTELSVLEKKEVPVADFFRSYNLTEFNAKLIVKPDDLKTSTDKKKKDESLMYLAPDRNQIYFSSYGDDAKNGRDIYYVTRGSGGNLSKPTRVSDVINTKYDEDYAFLHPNGKTLYFCSKGHNSMGGYDIFRSEWDNSTQAWGKPVNMDFAINTPDDDILFVSDAEDKSAYFSSKRASADGSISVYKIKLDRKPLDLAIITGTLTKNVGDKMAKATITVTKVLKDEVVGVFNTNAADGSYTLNLPNGGKFMFAVESPGFKKTSELVVVPNQREIKPMKQEIALVNEGGQDKVIIKNEFDALVDSAELQLAAQYLKAKATLEVSPAEEEVKSVAVEDKTATNADAKTEANKAAPVNNNDIIDMAYQDSKETQKDANEARKMSDAADQLARQKNEQSMQKYKEAQEITKTAETVTNQEEKMAQTDKAAKLRKESETLSKESALSFTLSNQMDVQSKAKQEQADAELRYAKDLENAIKSGANEKRMNDLLAQKEALDKKGESIKTAASASAETNKEAGTKQTEASKAMAKYLDKQQDVEDIQAESKRLRAEADKTKNEGVKQNLIQQADDLDKEAEAKKKEAEVINTQAKQLQAKADSLKSNASMTSSVIKEVESKDMTNVVATTAETKTVTTGAAKDVPAETTNTVTAEAPKTENAPAAPAPLVITSPYVDVFVSQMHEAESKSKELDKQESLAVIYQAWTDSLDKQIKGLKYKLDHTNNPVYISQIQMKIYELESSVDDKRQKAADSRNKVDNLKLQEALAAASAVTPATTPTVSAAKTETVTASAPTSTPENLTGTENINSYYENKIKENAKTTNEYQKKAQEQELYQDWSSSLYDESQRLKKDGKNSKAEEAVAESKVKQAKASEAEDQATKIKVEHPELAKATPSTAPVETASVKNTPAENKTPSNTQPVPTPTVVPIAETTSSTVKTVTPANTATTSTVSATTSATKETPAANTNTLTASSPLSSESEPVKQPASAVVPESVKNKDEYTHFVALQNESDWAKKNSERQVKQADELQKQSDDQFAQSKKLTERSTAMNDPNIAAVLKQQSDDLDKQALRSQVKSDSLKILAKNSEAESNSKRTESELYLQSLDKAAYEEVATATGHPVDPEVLAKKSAAAPVKTETKTEPTVPATTTATPAVATHTATTTAPAANTETASSNTKTTAAEPTTAKTNSVTETNTPRTSTTVVASNKDPKTQPTATPTATAPVTTAPKTTPVNTTPAATTNKTENKTQPATNPATTAVKTEPKNTPANTSPALITNKTTPVTQPAATTAAVSKSNASADVLKYYDALFDKLELNGNAYSESKPIPVDAPMPGGLVFKVQIGAFRNPIAQNLFKGIKPVTAEKTPQGLMRYTAGLFNKFETANNAKTQVNGLGYRDAFVVAFFNGKRISINEALAKAKENGENVDLSAINTTTQPALASSAIGSSTSTAVATDVRSLAGLFYTIQIGVFSKAVNSTQLYDIAPLNSEKTDNGLIRYTTGRFNDEAKASKAKNNISQKGITDAFVIAYHDGKRISLSAAKALIDAQGKNVLSKDKQEYTFVPSDTTTTEASATTLTTSSNLGIVFKVQVGAYKEQVPIAVANKLLANSKRGIKTFRDDNGLLVYTIGEFLEYESANNLKAELVKNGLNDAFVIAFKNGKKITATEALNLIRNK